MKSLDKKSVASIRVIAGNIADYDIRYRDLQKKLTQDNLFALFAEPLVVGKHILWQTPLNGAITKYSDLPDEDKNSADSLLDNQVNEIVSILSESMDAEKIKQYLTFPSNEDKYLIKTNDGNKVIITQWGCVPDNANQHPVTIIKDENFPVPVVFIVKYKNGELATNENIFIEFNNIANEKNSGEEAKIDFGKTTKGTSIKVFQLVEDKKMFVHNFTVDNRIEYIVELPPLQTMRFVVKNTNGELQTAYTVNFEYSGNTIQQITNENAVIEIENIKVGTTVNAYHIEAEQKQHPHTFVCHDNNDEYLIQIPAPITEAPPVEIEEAPKKAIRVKLIDSKNKAIAEQEIEFTHKGKVYKLTTNSEGYCILDIEDINKDEIIKALINIKKT